MVKLLLKEKVEVSLTIPEKATLKKDKKRANHRESLDKKIEKLESRIDEAKAKLFLEEVYTDPLKYKEIEEEIERLEEELNQCLLEWS